MIYKTELHIHSADVSRCASADADLIVERYLAYGYTTIVLANHLSKFTYQKFGDAAPLWEDKIRLYIDGYKKLEQAAAGRLYTIMAMELRFMTDDNDYLVFGMTEDFMRSHDDLTGYTLKSFVPLAHQAGMLVIQAHPFRNTMTIRDPSLLDGIEVFNGHPGHDSRNDIANLWADKFSLRKTSGTDFHQDKHHPDAGITTDYPICDGETLLRTLRDGTYGLIRGEIIPM